MKDLSYTLLRPAAEDALGASRYSPRKLVLLHTGITLGAGLVLNLLSYVLDLGIAQTGGLSGMENRAVLQSLQAFLTIITTILLPFWEIGYIAAALQFARRQSPNAQSLLGGLRNWGVVLRSLLLKVILVFAALFIGAQITSFIYYMTPMGAPLTEMTLELLESGADPMAMLENEAYLELTMQAVPFMAIGAGILALPVLYLLRFSDYVLMDQPERGALFALLVGVQISRRHLKALLKLDLRFWWYYLLEVLVAALGYGHLILEMAGVELGVGGDTAMFVFYLVSLAGQLGLYVWKKNSVYTTFAAAYDCITQPLPADAE